MDLAAKDTIATKSRLLGAKYVYAFVPHSHWQAKLA